MSIKNLFNKYIKGSNYKEYIIISRIFVCKPKKEIQKILGKYSRKVFITTKSLKHIYDRHIFDKKVPKDFYIIINNILNIIGNPNRIYLNKRGKRGNFLFIKEIKRKIYMCTIEIINENELEIVSVCTTGEKYLSKFTLLWS